MSAFATSTSSRAAITDEVLLHRLLHPVFLVGGLWLVERQQVGRLLQRAVRLAGELAQQLVAGRELALGFDDCGGRAVVRGAGFLHVGDRDQPDLEALLGLLELAREGIQRGLGGGQRVLGGEHVEVALRDSHHQVLLGGAIVRLGDGHRRVGALQCLPLVPAEQRLAQLALPLPGVRVGLLVGLDVADHRRRGRIVVVIDCLQEGVRPVTAAGLDRAEHAHLRQQRGARLRLGLERGRLAGLGFAYQRIAGRGTGVDLDEVLGAAGLGRQPTEYGDHGTGEQGGLRVRHREFS